MPYAITSNWGMLPNENSRRGGTSDAEFGPHEAETLPALYRGCRALVAEDDDRMRQLVVSLLEMDGYEVVAASSGDAMVSALQQETLVAAPSEAFDIIVSDLRMPGTSGLEVLSRLRRIGCATPVIMMTAFPDPEVQKEAELLNALVLAKPFGLQTLRSAVRFYTNLSPRYASRHVRSSPEP